MKRELGFGRCGLCCALCTENDNCHGCNSGECPGVNWCENYKRSKEKGLSHCCECSDSLCRKGLLKKIKPRTFNLFIARYGKKELLDCLEHNEKNGVRYHVNGVNGDYDDFDSEEELIKFIKSGKR